MSQPRTTLEVTAAERRLLQNALETYLSDFGHEDHDLIVAARHLIARLDEVQESVQPAKAAG